MHLRRMVDGVEVFCPKLRVQRQTRRGLVWFVEALFPGYLFAKFHVSSALGLIRSTPGVKAVVSFGSWMPFIEDSTIESLRAHFDESEVHEIVQELEAGDEVSIAAGPFSGLNAMVLKVRSASQRVQVLLDVLGRSTPVEMSRADLVTQRPYASFLAA
jgi:transcription antitermination factor NusG